MMRLEIRIMQRIASPEMTSIVKKLVQSRFARKFTDTVWGRVFLVVWIGKTVVFYLFLLIRILLLSMVFLIASNVEALSQDNYLGIARFWFENRAEGHTGWMASDNSINKAIEYYGQALADNPYSEEAATGLLKSYYFKIVFTKLSKNELRVLTQDGVDLSEKLEKNFQESGPYHYWSASLWSVWAENHGLIKSCYEGVADRIKTHSEKVVQLDPDYRSSGGYRLLGLVHYYAPRIPLILNWSSKNFSENCLTKAAGQSPEHPGNLIGLAKLYIKMEREYESTLLLEKIIITPPRPNMYLEDMKIIHEAEKMLMELRVKTQ